MINSKLRKQFPPFVSPELLFDSDSILDSEICINKFTRISQVSARKEIVCLSVNMKTKNDFK